MAQTVVGFFDNAAEAQSAVQQLVSNGFSRENIDISAGGSGSTGQVSSNREESGNENGITRFFKSLFGDDDDEAQRYSTVGQKSGSIVTVHAQSSDEAERAADLLDDYGAVNVNERASQYGYDSDRSTTNVGSDRTDYSSDRTDYVAGPSAGLTSDRTSDISSDRTSDMSSDRTSDMSSDRTSDREASIPRIQEELEVGKRTVEGGGVRVRSRIVERPVEEHVRLRQESVHVERNPVNRPVSESELANFQEREIELTESEEVPVVNKQAHVVEEIRISKEVTERDETVRDTVRNTEVDIENLNNNQRTEGRNDLNTDRDRGYTTGNNDL